LKKAFHFHYGALSGTCEAKSRKKGRLNKLPIQLQHPFWNNEVNPE